jgi:hypothetical protein
MEGTEFPSEESLLAAIPAKVPDPMVDTLTAIFAKWVERLRLIALYEGHYYR